MFSARQIVELFHLVFLRALVAKGDDKALIALKGGCNLRFNFDSVRYSEDIARPEAAALTLSATQKRWIAAALDRAIGISFDEYRSTVVACLEPNQVELYQAAAAWDAMQSTVVSRLEALQ